MLHALQSWAQLTRYGVPAFTVARRPLPVSENLGSILEVGAEIPNDFTGVRIRQLYEQRRIAPIQIKKDAAMKPAKKGK